LRDCSDSKTIPKKPRFQIKKELAGLDKNIKIVYNDKLALTKKPTRGSVYMNGEDYKEASIMVEWFHWIWIALLVSGLFIKGAFPWYAHIHNAVVATTVMSQILWLGCPIVAIQEDLMAKYDHHKHLHGSLTCYLIEKFFDIKVPWQMIASQLAITMVATLLFFLR
jgi:hypothetical protein